MSFVLLESYVAFWSRLIIILLRVYIALQMTRQTALFIQLSYYAFLYFEQQLKFPLKILSTKNKYFHIQFKSKKYRVVNYYLSLAIHFFIYLNDWRYASFFIRLRSSCIFCNWNLIHWFSLVSLYLSKNECGMKWTSSC